MSYDQLPEQVRSDVMLCLQLRSGEQPPAFIQDRIEAFWKRCCILGCLRAVDPQVLALICSLPEGKRLSQMPPVDGDISKATSTLEQWGGKHVETTLTAGHFGKQKIKRMGTFVEVGKSKSGSQVIRIRFDDDPENIREIEPRRILEVKEA